MATNNTINIKEPRPVFSAYLSGNIANQTGDGTVYTIVNDVEFVDTTGSYNNGTGIFTAPETAPYMFNYDIKYGPGGTTTNTISYIVSAGSNYAVCTIPTRWRLTNFYGNGGFITLQGSQIVQMTVGDTAYLVIQGSGGTKIDTIYGLTGNFYYTHFDGYRVF
jgi:hypothetical protein